MPLIWSKWAGNMYHPWSDVVIDGETWATGVGNEGRGGKGGGGGEGRHAPMKRNFASQSGPGTANRA